MNKNDIIVLLKKREGRCINFNYKFLYLDKTHNILTGSKVFHICEEMKIVDNKELMLIEDFDYSNICVALLSFYYEELKQVEINENILSNLLSSLSVNYEGNTSYGYNDKMLEDNQVEIDRIWKLINKWCNEDKIK